MDGHRGPGTGGGDLIKFRNYQPHTHFLEGLYELDPAQPATIEQFIGDKLELIEEKPGYKVELKDFEFKKPDWDLKKRLEKKSEKLERETRRCIDKEIKNRKSKQGNQ